MHATSAVARAGLCALMASAPAALPAHGQIVINEFLPDPAGSDAGREFVELLNTGADPVDLGGWQLQFANGAEAVEWLVRWTGQAGQALAPGARFLIVDRNWAGTAPADAEVALALQNGPDAIRLVAAGLQRDLVGYGALTDPELLEGTPVPLVPGRSLARRPDGRDSDDNRADFTAAEPTPGTPNFARHALTVIDCGLEPPSAPRAGAVVLVSAVLRNDGTEALPLTRVSLACGPARVPAILDGTASGDERRLDWTLRPDADGQWPLQVLVPLPQPAETLAVDLGRLQVGPAALVLSEVLAAPRSGQGEWLEIASAGSATVDLAGHRVRDADGDWVDLPAIMLPAGERLVVAQDSTALLGWLAANAGGPANAGGCDAPVRQLTPWPALNNAPPEAREHADRVLLADPAGTVIDQVVIGADGEEVSADRSLERVDPAAVPPGSPGWAECLAGAGATPGCANSVAGTTSGPVGAGSLAAAPAVADRQAGQAAIHLSFTVPAVAAGWDLVVYDLDGRAVRDLGGDGRGPGPRTLFWDLCDDHARPVAAGGYVAALRWRSGGRTAGTSPRRLLVVR